MPRPIRTSPYRGQLRAYQASWKCDQDGEGWKTDHEELKRQLWAFEDKLAVGLSLFKAIAAGFWNWQRRIRDGEQKYHPEDDAAWRETWEWWLRPCDEVMAWIADLEGKYGRGEVEGSAQFRRACEEARHILKKWSIPEGAEGRVTPHTNRTLTAEQVADELNKVSRPVTAASVPLKHKIDESRVF